MFIVPGMAPSLTLKLLAVLLLGSALRSVEGGCSVEHCTDRDTCVLSRDQKSCKCVRGYYSDHCDKNAHIKVMCGRDYISIRAAEEFFKYHNVPLESLHLPNKSCRAHREVIDGVPYYMSRLSKDEYVICGGNPLVKNYTHISYTLTLLSEPQPTKNIIRHPVIKIDYTCHYPYIRRVSLPFAVIPFSSETVIQADEHDVTIQMMLYTDQTYSTVFSSPPIINLGDKVYVEVTVKDHPDHFLLRVNDCWATHSHQPTKAEGSVHHLLLNGCVSDPTVVFLNVSEGKSGRNGESSTVRYGFNMFRFTAEPHKLYLHCTVQLCDQDELASCTPNCNSISKREAVRPDPNPGLLSYGPITIEIPDRPQSNLLLSVVLIVAGIWCVGFFLIILTTVARAGSKRLAQVEQ